MGEQRPSCSTWFPSDDPATDEDEIPDPWGGPSEGYDETIRLVTAAAEGLVLTLAATRA